MTESRIVALKSKRVVRWLVAAFVVLTVVCFLVWPVQSEGYPPDWQVLVSSAFGLLWAADVVALAGFVVLKLVKVLW